MKGVIPLECLQAPDKGAFFMQTNRSKLSSLHANILSMF